MLNSLMQVDNPEAVLQFEVVSHNHLGLKNLAQMHGFHSYLL